MKLVLIFPYVCYGKMRINMMNIPADHSLWGFLENITEKLKNKRLADVFRFVSFRQAETFGPHQHLRIEMNYVKKGTCVLRLENESVSFGEHEMMIICSNVEHTFEAGPQGTTLMQLEFLPEIFSCFDLHKKNDTDELTPEAIFSEENRLIKIVNNTHIAQAIQRIVNEMNLKNKYYQYMVVMYYAELLILIYRYMDENYLPICTNESLKKAIAYIRLNYHSDITISDITEQAGIGERYLRKLFVRHLNFSPLDFLNQIRINKSIDLLRNTEMSIKEVCFICGFKSPQYFSRVFKKQMGIPPREAMK